MALASGGRMSKEIYQIKVALVGIKPPIWRRLLVPANLTLADLHEVLQVAMGWQNYHLHEFCIGNQSFMPPDPDLGSAAMVDRTPRLKAVLGKVGAKAEYTYDFGDGWLHTITVEKILLRDPKRNYPVCVGGKRRCPPEDCGGVYGYYDFLDAIMDRSHPRHREMLDWIGDGYDPNDFSIAATNIGLSEMRL